MNGTRWIENALCGNEYRTEVIQSQVERLLTEQTLQFSAIHLSERYDLACKK